MTITLSDELLAIILDALSRAKQTAPGKPGRSVDDYQYAIEVLAQD